MLIFFSLAIQALMYVNISWSNQNAFSIKDCLNKSSDWKSTPMSNVSDRMLCYYKGHLLEDRALNKVYKLVMELIDDKAKQNLLIEQRQWIKTRDDKALTYIGEKYESLEEMCCGQRAELSYYSKMYELTKIRVAELTEYIKEITDKNEVDESVKEYIREITTKNEIDESEEELEEDLSIEDSKENQSVEKQAKTEGWSYNGKILHPQCFKNYWDSADNYQEYYEHFTGIKEDYFSTKEYEDFTSNLGKYWGKEITTFDPINTGWGGEHELLELAVSMKSCLNKKTKVFEVLDDRVTSQTAEPKDRNEYYYQELKKIPLETCQSLAPNIKGKCIQSYLLKIGEWGGGSMGHTYEWSIFGLFKLSNNDEYIFPLKRFVSKDEALGYEF